MMKLQNPTLDRLGDFPVVVNLALDILRKVEDHVSQLEAAFGRKRLLKTIFKVGPEAISQHVANHRRIIRNGNWPNEVRPSSFSVFCNEYMRAAIAYATTGFEALDFLAGNSNISIEKMYFRVLCSEALRGQYGKRSPTGLDQRLERTTEDLESCLRSTSDEDAFTEDVNTFCTPITPWLSAEAALLEDFSQLRQHFITPPTIDEILSSDGIPQDVAWNFLRRHVKWNVLGMSRFYSEFSTSEFCCSLNTARAEREKICEKHRQVNKKIAEKSKFGVESEVFSMAREIKVLNQLNLTLEPYYSFKGSPGLPQALVMQEASRLGVCHSYSLDELNAGKWALFHSTNVKEI